MHAASSAHFLRRKAALRAIYANYSSESHPVLVSPLQEAASIRKKKKKKEKKLWMNWYSNMQIMLIINDIKK